MHFFAALAVAIAIATGGTPQAQCSLDRNGDGIISSLEQSDYDCDGAIGILDLAVVGSHFLQHVPGPETPTQEATWTPTPTSTPTSTEPPTSTPTDTATATDTASAIPTATITPTETPTPSPSPVPTDTSTPTATRAPPSPSPTSTASPSPSPTSSPSSTRTPSPTRTATPVPTSTSTPVPTATTATLTELLIAERGDHAAAHEITLVDPPRSYDWGLHSKEYAKTQSGSLTPWLVAERDASQINTTFNARVAIRRIRMYVLKSGVWHLGYDGLPQWMVSSNPETNGQYVDIGHTVEADGSWSFAFPAGRALHMAANSPTYVVSGANGVAVVIEARVVGAQAASTRWGLNAGADVKAADGSCSAICGAAGIGRFGLLTGSYRNYTMLSTTLSDSQFRATPPPLSP